MNIEDMLRARHNAAETVSPDLFAKAAEFVAARQMRELGVYPFFQPLENNEGCIARINGTDVVMLGSNNYLGLTTDPRVREAAATAARKYGTSCTGSRLLNGTFEMHERLEERLAKFTGKEAALVFSTGYHVNVGIVTALVGANDLFVYDESAHASLQDAGRIARGKRERFAHNDVADLARVLERRDRSAGCLVAVDGVYSMEGDVPALPEMVRLAKANGARFLLDEAHGFGAMGKGGKGVAAHFGVSDEIDLLMGTFSKSFASIGGFAAGPRDVIDYIKHFGRSIIFTASLPPPNLAAVDAALTILNDEPWRVEKLHANANYWRNGLKELGFDTGHSITPVVPVRVGSEANAFVMWRALVDAGVYTNAVIYPAVPRNGAILRTSLTATHETWMLDKALAAFADMGRVLGLIG